MNPTQGPVQLTPETVLISLLRRGSKGREKGSVSSCNVCGKTDSRNHSALNEKCPTHAKAAAGKWTKKIEQLETLLNREIPFVDRNDYNAQLKWYSDQLLIARHEHESYEPTEKEVATKPAVRSIHTDEPKDASALGSALRECLALMGARADGEKDPMMLVSYIKGNINMLLQEVRGK